MNHNFQRINNLTGWVVFAIALVVYWSTMEPTASYWDCGEFIAVSYKLEVPHPPGAPLFLLLGRMFSFLAFGDETNVAYWINFSSVLAGAFTSLFLFWSTVLFGRKLMKIRTPEELTVDRTWVLMGAGLVSALTFTFCDSAWFSNVEAEVYAMSSFFTAFVVWAMLKWDLIEDESKANRWLILIFYMMGLSIGIHLLNLVTIPALALIYYFKKYTPGRWGVVLTMLISLVIIFFINNLIIPGLPSIAGGFELFFVNNIGLPFGSGVIVFVLMLVAALIYGIRHSQKNNKPILNTFLLATTFILIGYSSYAMIVIRANFNPPINENDPSDVMSFVRYLKREQYGSRPLVYGQYFTAQLEGYDEGEPVYVKGKDKYEVSDRKVSYRYSAADQTLFPRIWSTDPQHQQVYRDLLGLHEGEKPKFFSDNLYYMFSHQIGWMYVRYFFFNFAGRESDNQNADWLSPGKWFEKLPPSLAENKGRNNFYMIPFVLGLVGMFYQSVHNTKNFVVVALLFILTGVALVIYLNSPPTEPRERDYIYTGSYYAFSFWIGFAVIAIAAALEKATRSLKRAGLIATLICLSAPVLMARDGWDDHNRSKRYFSVDSAINYLQSCAPNGILFTGGDNDTFPLWYSQEVEGVRTDVRVVVLSYYNTDWYIKQTMRQTYESEAFPYTLTAENYRQGGPNDYLPFHDLKMSSIDLKQYLELLKRDHKGLRLFASANAVPSRELSLKVDVEKVRALGIVPKELEDLIVPEMRLRLRGNGLEKKDLAMLDVLATADWERPLYVNNTSLAQFNVDLTPYVVQEGNAYRILPVQNPNPQTELVNTEISYRNVTEKFQFRGLDDSTIYYSPDYRSFVQNHRSSINSVATALIARGDSARAREILMFSLERMPDKGVPYDYTNTQTVELLLAVGETDQALEMANILSKRSDELASYYLSKREFGRDLQIPIVILGELQRVLFENGETETAEKIEALYEKHYAAFRSRGEFNRSDF
ncbi:MAG: DUF2723 domain-containing protein [Bacteroidota bacterium]|nr:DUF2723 domain-containing protein [Bacteroidota bacterium]